MSANKLFNFGPVALTTSLTTNIFNPPGAAAGVGGVSSGQYMIMRHLRVINKTVSAATFSLWKGASGANAAGTEVIGQTTSVAANSNYDWYGVMRFDTADFLVGGAGTATALTLQGEGEMGVAG